MPSQTHLTHGVCPTAQIMGGGIGGEYPLPSYTQEITQIVSARNNEGGLQNSGQYARGMFRTRANTINLNEKLY